MIRLHRIGMRKLLADFEIYLAALSEQQEAAEIHARLAALPAASSKPAEPPAPVPYRLHIALAYAALAGALLCLAGSY